MDVTILADIIIIAVVVAFAFFAVKPRRESKEETVKAVMAYLAIFVMLTGILLTCRCEREQKKHEPKEIRQ